MLIIIEIWKTYKVVEARLVSSFLICPSSAIPRLSLLLDSAGCKYTTFCRLEPGLIGQPSLLY